MSEIEEKIIGVTLQPSTQRVQTDTIRVHSIGLFTPSSSPTSHSLRTRIRRLFSSFLLLPLLVFSPFLLGFFLLVLLFFVARTVGIYSIGKDHG